MKLAQALLGAGIVLMLAACTPPPPVETPTTETAAPTASAAAETEWHLVVERAYPEADGERTCTLLVRVDRTRNGSTPEEVAAAVALLRETDWTTVEVSLDEYDADDLAARREQGVTDAQLLTMLVSDRIHAALADGGYLESGASVETQTTCDPA